MARVEVSKDEFYSSVCAGDVIPRCERDATYFETRYRELVGIKTPGYAELGTARYFRVVTAD